MGTHELPSTWLLVAAVEQEYVAKELLIRAEGSKEDRLRKEMHLSLCEPLLGGRTSEEFLISVVQNP